MEGYGDRSALGYISLDPKGIVAEQYVQLSDACEV